MARIYYPGRDPEVRPEKKREFRMDQLEAIYRIAKEVTDPDRSGAVLVGAGMGSGKTAVSVEVTLKARPKRVLIVGVRDAYNQWKNTFAEQQERLPVTSRRVLKRIDGTPAGTQNLQKLLDGDPGLFYAGLEMLRHQDWEERVSETFEWAPEIKAIFGDEIGDRTDPVKTMQQKHTYSNMEPVDLLISDESHKHSNQKTASLKTVRSIPARSKIALSGTFYGNKFENAWSLATWLWGKPTIGTKASFEANYCNKVAVMTKDGRRQVTTKSGFPLSKITGERFPGEYVQTLPCYVFIATPLGPVPPPEVVEVDLTPEQQRQYDQMEGQSLAWIPSTASTEREPLIADIPLVQRGRLRTAALGGMTLIPGETPEDADSITFEPGCKSNKLNVAHDVLHRPTWKGRKALILTHSKPFAKEVARRIGQKYTVALKTGDTRPKTWEDEKRRFMLPVTDPESIQYCVAVISAVGTATDGLQANCAKVLWLSEDDSAKENLQASNRVWREGVNLEEYEAVKLVSRNTIDEGVLHKNAASTRGILDSVAGLR